MNLKINQNYWYKPFAKKINFFSVYMDSIQTSVGNITATPYSCLDWFHIYLIFISGLAVQIKHFVPVENSWKQQCKKVWWAAFPTQEKLVCQLWIVSRSRGIRLYCKMHAKGWWWLLDLWFDYYFWWFCCPITAQLLPHVSLWQSCWYVIQLSWYRENLQKYPDWSIFLCFRQGLTQQA